MAASLSEDEFAVLLREESDTFRLTIRGHAAIDGKLDDLLADAFVGGIPAFLKGRSFRIKVELALALGLMPPTFSDPIARLTKLRDELAHGSVVDVDVQRAKDVFGGARALLATSLPDFLPADDPRSLLMISLGIVWFGLVACENVVRKHREDVRTAVVAAQIGAGASIASLIGQQLADAADEKT